MPEIRRVGLSDRTAVERAARARWASSVRLIGIDLAALTGADALLCLLLGAIGFFSRYVTRGTLYFGDAPGIVQSIRDHRYVIEPPGYWLYARAGSLFPDPVWGLAILNELFAGFGAVVFFFLCRKFGLSRALSTLATLAYVSVFFSWFAGDIQTSHGSQFLFAPLIVLSFLLYRDKHSYPRLVFCAVSFAAGAGMRPSDGVFMAPLFLFLLVQYVPGWPRRILLLVIAAAGCVAWYIPTQMAMLNPAVNTTRNELHGMAARTSLLLNGLNFHTLTNVARVVVPMLAAFWMMIPAIFWRRTRMQNRILLLWLVPGLAFFLLVSMAEAQYLTFLAGGVILLAALTEKKPRAVIALLICLVFNTWIFVGARPLPSNNKVSQAINFYVVKCSSYGIRHKWNLNIGNGGTVPR
jgi:Dolichyl-phosphate-mannose-protein mannosyltransferase